MGSLRIGVGTLALFGLAPFGGIVLSTGCGPAPAAPWVEGASHDLTLGSSGPEVERLYEYLKTYGYFPNDQLQSQYPAWRPIISVEPTHQDVFDDTMQKAVAALQRNLGLRATGVFDAATRDLTSQPRCSVPDGIQPLDPTDKWASLNTTQGWTQTVNWYVQNTDGDLPVSAVTADIQKMLNTWKQWSNYSFANSSSNAGITVSFTTLDSQTNASTFARSCAFGICGTVDPGVPRPSYVQFNSSRSWSDGTSIPPGKMDLPTIALHELGHALGLAHSSYQFAAMYPINNGTWVRDLANDDIVAIATTNPVYVNVGAPPDGPVQRAAQNNHIGGTTIWALAGNGPGGYHIWELNGAWQQLPGGAVRIAVNPGSQANQPWVIDNQNLVYRWNAGAQSWDNISACATDIGIGPDDAVWVIGCNPTPGGYDIYKYNGDAACAGGNCWTKSDGGALQIAVGAKSPSDNTTVPWVINDSAQIFRRTSSDPTVSGAWEQLPGLPMNATGIAAGWGYSYAIDSAGSGAATVFSWNEQPGFSGGSPPAPSERGWTALGLGTTSPHPTAIATGGLFPIMVANQVIYTVY